MRMRNWWGDCGISLCGKARHFRMNDCTPCAASSALSRMAALIEASCQQCSSVQLMISAWLHIPSKLWISVCKKKVNHSCMKKGISSSESALVSMLPNHCNQNEAASMSRKDLLRLQLSDEKHRPSPTRLSEELEVDFDQLTLLQSTSVLWAESVCRSIECVICGTSTAFAFQHLILLLCRPGKLRKRWTPTSWQLSVLRTREPGFCHFILGRTLTVVHLCASASSLFRRFSTCFCLGCY